MYRQITNPMPNCFLLVLVMGFVHGINYVMVLVSRYKDVVLISTFKGIVLVLSILLVRPLLVA